MSKAKVTTDHAAIRRWAEERGGRPSRVKDTGGRGGPGILRLDFGEPEDSLEPISWEEFFRAFEDNGLALLHQDATDDGRPSRFNKLVDRSESR